MIRRPRRSPLFPYTTLFRSFAVLRSSLNDAVRLELLPRSPARGIRLPPLERTDVTTLRLDELHRVADAVEPLWRPMRSEEHTSELQSRQYLVCRLLLEKKKT